MGNTAVVVELFEKVFGQGDRDAVNRLIGKGYVQHSTMAGDGRQGLLKLLDAMAGLPQPPRVDVKRAIADGDYVALHSEYDWGNKKQAVVDLFRLEEGVIVEHWDAMQDVVEVTASGRTMFDGPTAIADPDRTAANKALVQAFVEEILIGGRFDQIGNYFDGDTYIQHNPNVPDGLSGLFKAIEEMGKLGITMVYTRLHRVIGEGNVILTQSEGMFAGQSTAYYDLFRVENEKIAEHWDVMQGIPAEMPHGNGMF